MPDQLTANVLAAWNAASADELAEGLGWYQRASDLADALAAGAPISRAQACGVIAALSPRCGWSANVRGATDMVNAHAAGAPQPITAGVTRNRAKAWAILQSAGDPLDILGGPKVRAFYANIMGDASAVTVDVWATRAAEGLDASGDHVEGKRYQRIADAYRAAAALVGRSPRDVQAAVWVHIRRANARAIYDVREQS